MFYKLTLKTVKLSATDREYLEEKVQKLQKIIGEHSDPVDLILSYQSHTKTFTIKILLKIEKTCIHVEHRDHDFYKTIANAIHIFQEKIKKEKNIHTNRHKHVFPCFELHESKDESEKINDSIVEESFKDLYKSSLLGTIKSYQTIELSLLSHKEAKEHMKKNNDMFIVYMCENLNIPAIMYKKNNSLHVLYFKQQNS